MVAVHDVSVLRCLLPSLKVVTDLQATAGPVFVPGTALPAPWSAKCNRYRLHDPYERSVWEVHLIRASIQSQFTVAWRTSSQTKFQPSLYIFSCEQLNWLTEEKCVTLVWFLCVGFRLYIPSTAVLRCDRLCWLQLPEWSERILGLYGRLWRCTSILYLSGKLLVQCSYWDMLRWLQQRHRHCSGLRNCHPCCRHHNRPCTVNLNCHPCSRHDNRLCTINLNCHPCSRHDNRLCTINLNCQPCSRHHSRPCTINWYCRTIMWVLPCV